MATNNTLMGGTAGSQGESSDPFEFIQTVGSTSDTNGTSPTQLKLSDFSLGMQTRWGRGKQPLGSFAVIKNLVINRLIGSLSLRQGYKQYLLLPLTVAGNIVKNIVKHFPFYTYTPEPSMIDVIAGYGYGDESHIIQSPYWTNDPTIGLQKKTDWILWGEREGYISNINSGLGATSITFSGGNKNNNYYANWIVWNKTASQSALILNSSYSGGVTTLTLIQQLSNLWDNGEIIIYRHFHDNPTFIPSLTQECSAVQQNDDVLFSGGASDDVGCKLIHSGYESNHYFQNFGNDFLFEGTYISEAEIKTNGINITIVAGIPTIRSNGLNINSRWFAAFVVETSDGERSTLIKINTGGIEYINPTFSERLNITECISLFIEIDVSNLNKRIVALNLFMAQDTTNSLSTMTWDNYLFVKRLDLLNNTIDANGQCFYFQGANLGLMSLYIGTFNLDNSDWTGTQQGSQNLETAIVHLGTSEYTQSTVSCSLMEFVNNRLFVAKYYDYGLNAFLENAIRYSGFASNGIAQINVLPNISESSESYIQSFDATEIQTIKRWDVNLVVAKKNSSFYIPIEGDPSTWELLTLSKDIGCDAPDSIISTPFGLVWAMSNSGIFHWWGQGTPYNVAKNILPTLLGNSNPDLWKAWYDSSLHTYNIFLDNNSIFLSMFFDVPIEGNTVFNSIMPWTLNQIADMVKSQPQVNALGNIFFPIATDAMIAQFDKNSTDDNGVGIVPLIDTGDYILDEKELTTFRQLDMRVDNQGASEFQENNILLEQGGNLLTEDGLFLIEETKQFDMQVYVDDKLLPITALSNMTSNKERYSFKLPIVGRLGNAVRFVFNSNGTPASYTDFNFHNLVISFAPKRRLGDLTKSI